MIYIHILYNHNHWKLNLLAAGNPRFFEVSQPTMGIRNNGPMAPSDRVSLSGHGSVVRNGKLVAMDNDHSKNIGKSTSHIFT